MWGYCTNYYSLVESSKKEDFSIGISDLRLVNWDDERRGRISFGALGLISHTGLRARSIFHFFSTNNIGLHSCGGHCLGLYFLLQMYHQCNNARADIIQHFIPISTRCTMHNLGEMFVLEFICLSANIFIFSYMETRYVLWPFEHCIGRCDLQIS